MLYRRILSSRAGFSTLSLALTLLVCSPVQAQINLAQVPLFLGEGTTPLVMMVMGRDHELYYEAYNDATDLDGDGTIDRGYKPSEIDYFGYFNSYQCYTHSGNEFRPTSTTSNKTCSGSWSGDFLNYITTSRMDALRKVLYGGYRSTDTAGETVLERAYIPQDAHTWAKEYTSTAVDGYDIANYAPYGQPDPGSRHLFASVSSGNDPVLRVLTSSAYRAWEWVSINEPAGDNCQKTTDTVSKLCTDSVIDLSTLPQDSADFSNWESLLALPANQIFSGPITQVSVDNVDTNLYPPAEADMDATNLGYLNIIQGDITLRRGSPQTFAVDADGAVELLIDGIPVASRFGDNTMICDIFNVRNPGVEQSRCFGDEIYDAEDPDLVRSTVLAEANGMIIGTLSGDYQHTLEFRHVHKGADNANGFRMYWYDYNDRTPRWELFTSSRLENLSQTVYKLSAADPNTTMQQPLAVRVTACALNPQDDAGCKAYGDTGSEVYKPIGLLQEHGDDEDMFFGLLTGSFNKPTKGGVLRKNISSLNDEINLDDGTFTSTVGIIETLDRLRIADFDSSSSQYRNCAQITDKKLSELADEKCSDWGNPIAEMMYEALRYFTSKETPAPTAEFDTSGGTDGSLGLPAPTWSSPYDQGARGDFSVCSKPNMLVIGDQSPSYDTDQLPGVPSQFSSGFSGDLEGLDVSADATTIWASEVGGRVVFVGETVNDQDNLPTIKGTGSFNIRGIAPEDTTKEGGWYAASVAYYGLKTDLNDTASNQQNVRTYAVAMASHLPRIEIPILEVIDSGGETEEPTYGGVVTTVELVPFAKSVGELNATGTSSSSYTGRDFQPSSPVLDFYIEDLRNDYGRFRVYYGAVEQGDDHVADMVVEYTYRIIDMSKRLIEVEVKSLQGSDNIIQHAGYIITGITGTRGFGRTYLVVRDNDTSESLDVSLTEHRDFDAASPLPTRHIRTFRAESGERPVLLKDPLWYAAKWGNFNNIEPDPENPQSNPKPDQQDEWDADGDGDPDDYFLVTNALDLNKQISSAFQEIMAQTASAAGVSASSTRLDTDVRIYQSVFNSGFWTGDLRAFAFDASGKLKRFPEWNAADSMPSHSARNIYVGDEGTAKAFLWGNLSQASKDDLMQGGDVTMGQDRLNYFRGDQSKEEHEDGIFRDRVEEFPGRPRRKNVLGDIINSAAAYVADVNYGMNALPEDMGGADYTSWRSALTRPSMVYVGANDGMLHAFDAATGTEQWAYIPGMVLDELHELSDPNYTHRYYVDGSPRVSDVYVNFPGGVNSKEWGTVLVGSQGGGGHGLFAIDVTDPSLLADPSTFNADKVLWEFSPADDDNLGDLGHTLSQPTIAAMQDGNFYAIFGNGYDSANNSAALYIVDLVTGVLKKKLMLSDVPGQSGPQGLSSPAVVDVDGDRVADVIYAGDLRGNLWEFDVSSAQPSFNNARGGWVLGGRLFTATGPNGEVQPITHRPEVAGHPDGGYQVFFGTGRYLALGDEVVPELEEDRKVYTFYGIRDNGTSLVRDTTVLPQTIIAEDAAPNEFGQRYRETSEETPGTGGWYMDLISPNEGKQEERVVVEPVLSGGEIIFVTLIPSEDACAYGGESWVMSVDAFTGQLPDTQTMDTDGDGLITEDDRRVSGARSTVGITSRVTVLERADGTRELIVSGTAPGEGSHLEQRSIEGSAAATDGRQAWRQVK